MTESLIFPINCNYISQGKIKIRPENLSTREFDFGDGICDNQAQLTRNGVMVAITML